MRGILLLLFFAAGDCFGMCADLLTTPEHQLKSAKVYAEFYLALVQKSAEIKVTDFIKESSSNEPKEFRGPKFDELVVNMAGVVSTGMLFSIQFSDSHPAIAEFKQLAEKVHKTKSEAVFQAAWKMAHLAVAAQIEPILERAFTRHDELLNEVQKNAEPFLAKKLSPKALDILAANRGLYRDVSETFARLRRELRDGGPRSIGFIQVEETAPPAGKRPIGFIWPEKAGG